MADEKDEQTSEIEKAPEAESTAKEEGAKDSSPSAESKDPSQPLDASADIDDDLAEAMDADESTGEVDDTVDIDEAIAEVDPNFQNELNEISTTDFGKADIKAESSVEGDLDQEKVPSAFKSFLKNLPKEIKTRYLTAIILLSIMVPLAIVIFMGNLLPEFKIPYVVSMDELTQKSYPYPTDGVYVPLFDDFRSNATTYSLPKTTITLKRTGNTTSYGNFEFFLNLRDKDLVPQIDLKQSEIVDLIQRTLEEVTWQDLQTPSGKERVKKVIRHRVNEHLQGNLVLGVYYRSVILQK